MQRIIAIVLVCWVGLSGITTAATAQDTPRAIKILDSKAEKYEKQMESLRQRVDVAISNHKFDDLDDQEKQLAAWRSRGKSPNVKAKDRFESTYAKHVSGMLRAFGDAGKQLATSGDQTLIDHVKGRSDRFKHHVDLVPWGDNIITNDNAGIEPGSFWAIMLPMADNYRFEIVAKRTEGEGFLELGLPAGETSLFTLPIQPDVNGEVHLILSVMDGQPVIELGLNVTLTADVIDLELPAPGALRVFDSEWQLVSVRSKPIIEGDLPETGGMQQRMARDKPRKERKTAADLMPVGSVWRGTIQHNVKKDFDVRWVVKEVSDDTIVFQGSWLGSSHLEFVFEYSGTTMTLVSMRELTKTNATRSSVSGGGGVRNEIFKSSFKWRVDYGSVRNSQAQGTLSLKRVD